MRLSDSVSFSVYRKIFKRYFSTFWEKCPRSVNNFRTNYFFVNFQIFGDFRDPKWSPTPPIPGVNVKVPFWGKKYGNKWYLFFFCDLYELFYYFKKWNFVLKFIFNDRVHAGPLPGLKNLGREMKRNAKRRKRAGTGHWGPAFAGTTTSGTERKRKERREREGGGRSGGGEVCE